MFPQKLCTPGNNEYHERADRKIKWSLRILIPEKKILNIGDNKKKL